ncbi:MAG: nitrile hydratase subunit alpha [Gammaproteobacteria bacterium]|nr:nitrile hydratase subunit alpha [Gammaproteobacteria bacterium]
MWCDGLESATSCRSCVVRGLRAVLAEFGADPTDNISVRVHDSTAKLRYMVLPQKVATIALNRLETRKGESHEVIKIPYRICLVDKRIFSSFWCYVRSG